MNLSNHFTLEELTNSEYATRKGIDNTPSPEVCANLQVLANGLERVRALIGGPMRISSGYRSPKLNSAIGGATDSYHLRGLAADFTCPAYGSPKDIAECIADHEDAIGFDKLIYEGTWVHVQFPDAEDAPRGDILTAHFNGGRATYTKGIA